MFTPHYKRSGKGQPFFFQHGLASNLNQPQELLGEFQGIELISMDCPGHGSTPLGNTIPSFDHYTDQIIALMDHLNIEQGILGGISMGSGIALNMAIRYPNRVRSLVLVRPAWVDKGCPRNLSILLQAAHYMEQERGALKFGSTKEWQELHTTLPRAAESVMGVFDTTQRKELPKVLTSMINSRPFPTMEILSSIHIPCIILANEADPLHPLEMAEAIHQRIPGSQLFKIPSRYLDEHGHRKSLRDIVSNFILKHEKPLERH